MPARLGFTRFLKTQDLALPAAYASVIPPGGYETTPVVPDSVPDAFSFTDAVNVEPNTLTESNIITPTGFNQPVAYSVSPTGALKVNGVIVTSGTLNPGDTVQARRTSSATLGGTATAAVTVAGVTTTWTVTTRPYVYDFEPALGKMGGFTLARNAEAIRTDLTGTGVLAATAANQLRIDQLGYAILSGARTNTFMNNEWAGGVASPPSAGTAPTGANVSGVVAGLTRTLQAFGTDEFGLPYMEMRIAGTATGSAQVSFAADSSTNFVSAVTGEKVAAGAYTQIMPSSAQQTIPAGLTPQVRFVERDSAGTSLGTFQNTVTLTTTRTFVSAVRTLSNASAARATSGIGFTATTGTVVDLTIRISGYMFSKAQHLFEGIILTNSAAKTVPAEVLTRACTDTEMAQGHVIVDWYYDGIASVLNDLRDYLWHYADLSSNRLALIRSPGNVNANLVAAAFGSALSTGFTPAAAGAQRTVLSWGASQGLLMANNGVALGSMGYTAPSGSVVETIGGPENVVSTSIYPPYPRKVKRVRRFPNPLADQTATTAASVLS